MKEPTINELAYFLRTWGLTLTSLGEEIESGKISFSKRHEIVKVLHDASEIFRQYFDAIAGN